MQKKIAPLAALLLGIGCAAYWLFAVLPYLRIEGARLVAPTMEICADQMGRLLYAPHEEGAMVREGEMLYSLASGHEREKLSQMQKEIDGLEKTLANHLAGIEQAMQDYLVSRVQFAGADVSEGHLAILENHQSQTDVCREKIRIAQENRRAYQMQIDQKSLMAPFSGVIAKREKLQGEIVQFGDPIYSF